MSPPPCATEGVCLDETFVLGQSVSTPLKSASPPKAKGRRRAKTKGPAMEVEACVEAVPAVGEVPPTPKAAPSLPETNRNRGLRLGLIVICALMMALVGAAVCIQVGRLMGDGHLSREGEGERQSAWDAQREVYIQSLERAREREAWLEGRVREVQESAAAEREALLLEVHSLQGEVERLKQSQ
ncbi:hypothetical protein KIPB_002296 [Kipferlia bialata]|uniref:Uncharacterized protein n=1 Tax=Kipferlia bialata TaxID=797122 RepID=A0A9K3CTK6_9EUKA|nr:hypothetical protein KIPB_002296 [Kipferlia bialata]|eukprot:g2296.t1